MNLDDAWDAEVTKREAVRELLRHGADVATFFVEVGERHEYAGGEVLAWLGY